MSRSPNQRLLPKLPVPLRRWLRALHRDAGYLVVGLTVVYALSGLAVNHIADWDPNFTQFKAEYALTAGGPLVDGFKDESATADAQTVMHLIGLSELPKDVYVVDGEHMDITLSESTLFVDLASGRVRQEGQSPRFLIRAANYLHLNRGKKAWTYVADGYAVLLLFLAASGLFMIPVKKGLLGRRGVLVALGALIPIGYVLMSDLG